MTLRALVITGGHPFDRAAFVELLDALPDVEWEHVQQPEAMERLAPGRVGADVVVAYDLPGIRFRPGELPELPPPPESLVAGFEGLLDEGQPFVFLHHAIASWPAWPGFAEIVGGRYHYCRGRAARARPGRTPATGTTSPRRSRWSPLTTRWPRASRRRSSSPTRPTSARSSRTTSSPWWSPTPRAARTPTTPPSWPCSARRYSNEGWHHPPGSSYVAWVKRSGRSPVAYLQPGDGPEAFGNPNFRRLLLNAIQWAASPEARAWAAG